MIGLLNVVSKDFRVVSFTLHVEETLRKHRTV